MPKPTTTSDVEIKGAADFKKMGPDEFEAVCKTKHAEIRSFCSKQVIDAAEKHLQSGLPIESLFVGLFHIGEAIIPPDTKANMKQNGIEVGCMPVDREEFAKNLTGFIHPETGKECYKPLVDALLLPQVPGHFFVASFAMQNVTLTRVKLGEMKEFHEQKLIREEARAKKIAERERQAEEAERLAKEAEAAKKAAAAAAKTP